MTETDPAWAAVWDARQCALSAILGPTTGRVLHAVIPLELGGSADVLEFPQHLPGATFVTADLTGPSSEQLESSLGQYELMICTRTHEGWAPNLISRLAKYTLDAVLVLCVGITAGELQACLDGQTREVVAKLGSGAVLPYTDLRRPSVV